MYLDKDQTIGPPLNIDYIDTCNTEGVICNATLSIMVDSLAHC